MKVVVFLDFRFSHAPDGSVWTTSAFPARFWERYLSIFSSVAVVARSSPIDEPSERHKRVDGGLVEVFPIPAYVGPWQYLYYASAVRREVRSALALESAVLCRAPSLVADVAISEVWAAGRPFGLEVVGDPWDSLGPGNVQVVGRPVYRYLARARLKRACRLAACVAYVTKEYLQRRYPCGSAANAGISDVELGAFGVSTHYSSSDIFESDVLRKVNVQRHRDAWTIVFVGSLAQRYKGLDVLLRACAALKRHGWRIRLVVLGDGRYRPEYERLAQSLELTDVVSFRGEIPAGEPVRVELAHADLFVLPSRTEGLPRALIEAMANGVPCIATRVGGIPELLASEDLFEKDDLPALTDLVQEVFRSPTRRQAMVARNLRTVTSYTEEALQVRRDQFYGYLKEVTMQYYGTTQGRTGLSKRSGCASTTHS